MVEHRTRTPDRGDIIWINFTPYAGHEQGGRRPAVVLSPASYNGRVGLALMCPITSHAKGYPFEVALPLDGAVNGVALADQIKSLDWRARDTQIMGSLPITVVGEILDRLFTLLT